MRLGVDQVLVTARKFIPVPSISFLLTFSIFNKH